jgi:hypothetical protein
MRDPEELEKLRALGVKGILERARLEAVIQLLLKVEVGEASPSELAVLRNLLRDNGIVMGLDMGGGDKDDDEGDQAMGFHLPTLQDDNNEEDYNTQ